MIAVIHRSVQHKGGEILRGVDINKTGLKTYWVLGRPTCARPKYRYIGAYIGWPTSRKKHWYMHVLVIRKFGR